MTQTTLPPTRKNQPVSAPPGGISDRSRAERKLGVVREGSHIGVKSMLPHRQECGR